MPKPEVEPRYARNAGAFGVGMPGAASAGPRKGEVLAIRPGSESRAKAWDGAPGNTRDPACVRDVKEPERRDAGGVNPWPGGALRATGSAVASTKEEERAEPATETIREQECASGKS
jgi:hypothetical protein